MLRVDLLRSLPRSATTTPAHSGKSAPTARATSPSPSGSPGPLKPVLTVLLLLLVAGLASVWFAKPEWLNLKGASSLWTGRGDAHADSVRQAELRHREASRQVEARQAAAVAWLTELESVLPVTEGFGSLSLTSMSFAASGSLVLEGEATSAEALSAFQEALVLVPGMELSKSQATEDSIRGGHFTFRFEGLVVSEISDTVGTPKENAEGVEVDGKSTSPRSRIVSTTEIPTQLDSMVMAAAMNGFTFAKARKGRVSSFAALNAHAFRLKGTPVDTTARADSTVITNLRNLLDQELARGSPFAFQRITILWSPDSSTVFLDILALTR